MSNQEIQASAADALDRAEKCIRGAKDALAAVRTAKDDIETFKQFRKAAQEARRAEDMAREARSTIFAEIFK